MDNETKPTEDKMTKSQAYQEAAKLGAGFLANVVLTSHRNPARKLKGLVNLLNAEHSVKTGNQIDNLLIDGYLASWIVLEEWAKRTA